jgi:DNA-binding transcriptional MerR regulator
MKLTIGQVADYVGVTIRAIRHYHQRGLLAEPDRDFSGYRRYDANAIVDLIKIKTLADSGVPLARIKELLQAEPGEFAKAVSQIDAALRARIRDLQEQRRRIAGLAAGDTLFLPPKIAELLDRLRAIGVGARTIQIERDGWILLAARFREAADDAAGEKLTALADADFRQIYLAYDRAADWDPSDPRLAEVAEQLLAFAARYEPGPAASPPEMASDQLTVALMAPPGDLPPAWRRLDEICREKAGRPRTDARAGTLPSRKVVPESAAVRTSRTSAW